MSDGKIVCPKCGKLTHYSNQKRCYFCGEILINEPWTEEDEALMQKYLAEAENDSAPDYPAFWSKKSNIAMVVAIIVLLAYGILQRGFFGIIPREDQAQAFNQSYNEYIWKITDKISKNWVPPVGEEDKVVTVKMKIAPNGNLLSSEIFKTSGSPKADQVALDAVKDSAPFVKAPNNIHQDEVDLVYVLDYKAKLKQQQMEEELKHKK